MSRQNTIMALAAPIWFETCLWFATHHYDLTPFQAYTFWTGFTLAGAVVLAYWIFKLADWMA